MFEPDLKVQNYLKLYLFSLNVYLNLMKKIKQITFDITQSRRIKNYAQKKKIKEKDLLLKYQEVMHVLYVAWKKNYGETEEISFRNFILSVMKYAEFTFRLRERIDDLEKINNHVGILRDALEEYERDYSDIIKIEEIVKDADGGLL